MDVLKTIHKKISKRERERSRFVKIKNIKKKQNLLYGCF